MPTFLVLPAAAAVLFFIAGCHRSLDEERRPDTGVSDEGVGFESVDKTDSGAVNAVIHTHDSATRDSENDRYDSTVIDAQNDKGDGATIDADTHDDRGDSASIDADTHEADGGVFQSEGGRPEAKPIDTCPTNLTRCNEVCVDRTSNVKHCGACDNVCPADSACIQGVCEDLCEPIEVSTGAELISRIDNMGWQFSGDVKTYLSTTSGITLQALDFGLNYMFTSSSEEVILSDETTYGFRDAYEGPNCDHYSLLMSPQVAYREVTIPAGTSFGVSIRSYATLDNEPGCSDGSHCLPISVHPGYSCCCIDQPVDWKIIRLIDPPNGCASLLDLCDTDFAGSNHSICYSNFLEYGEREKFVHRACVNYENGHLKRETVSCECDCSVADVVHRESGTCAENGLCQYSVSGFCTSQSGTCRSGW